MTQNFLAATARLRAELDGTKPAPIKSPLELFADLLPEAEERAEKARLERMQRWTPGAGKKRMGLTQEIWDRIIKKRKGKCPLCRSVMQVIHSDHCHDCGRFRDLICDSCNVGLGFFKDDPAALRRAAAYIEKHSSTH